MMAYIYYTLLLVQRSNLVRRQLGTRTYRVSLASLVVDSGKLLVSLYNGTLLTLDWDTGNTLSVDPGFFGSARGYMGRASAVPSAAATSLVVMMSSPSSDSSTGTTVLPPVFAYNVTARSVHLALAVMTCVYSIL